MGRGLPDVETIFMVALERPPGPEREAYLTAVCGEDVALKRRVEDLLAAHARTGDVLDLSGTRAARASVDAPTQGDDATGALGPAWSPDPTGPDASTVYAKGIDSESTGVRTRPEVGAMPGLGMGPSPAMAQTVSALDARSPAEHDGDVLERGNRVRYFGDYEIRRELGHGGMGVVYEARQISLNRPVALKMVRAGLLAGDDELRRFQNEAEAVALLDHPGVVPVYEVGEHEGQHFFSMKLVPGGSLVPLLERYKGDPRAAARLVAEAAEAVAHAHARGILHRDLKPANILVDAEGHPHVTDFGLAKRVEADVEFTVSGAILGTPAYMAPEQATGRRGSITTATDVYGLGAVLYALLAGKAPFGGDSVVETLDAVLNVPPEPPTRLNARIPGDLETICLKCLEKDPRRRYRSALALAEDLRRWLESRPIAARRVGAAERAWMWCRRRPAIAALSALVLLVAVGGTATIIAVQAAANRALGAKNDELNAALRREAAANAELSAANRRVEQRYDLAMDAIQTFHTGVSEDVMLKEPQLSGLRVRFLEAALQFYRKLQAQLQEADEPGSVAALADAYAGIARVLDQFGSHRDALETLGQALALRERLSESGDAPPGNDAAIATLLLDLCRRTRPSDRDKAERIIGRGVAILDRLVVADPSDRDSWETLASCHGELGAINSGRGNHARALEEFGQTMAIVERLLTEHPGDIDLGAHLVMVLINIRLNQSILGQHDKALATARRAVAVMEELRRASPEADRRVDAGRGALMSGRPLDVYDQWALSELAVAQRQVGMRTEAIATSRRALQVAKRLADAYPAILQYPSDLASKYYSLGNELIATGEPAEALAAYREAAAIWGKLAEANPGRANWRDWQSSTLSGLAVAQRQMGMRADAVATSRLALEVAKRLADAYPAILRYRGSLASKYDNLGIELIGTGEPAEALAAYREAAAIWGKLVEANPGEANWRNSDSHAWLSMAPLYLALGDRESYRRHCRRMLDRFGASSDPSELERTAKAGLLAPPPSSEEAARLRSLAATAVEHAGPKHHYFDWYLLALGLAEYRAGDPDAALQVLARFVAPSNNPVIRVPALSVRAMALHRLGRAEEAEAVLAEVKRLIGERPPPVTGPGWADGTIALLLAREAEAVVRFDPIFPADPFAP